MQTTINNSILELLKSDITESDCEAIVNAANAQLVLGGGVAGAIRKKGGPAIQAECNKIGGTFVGGAVITTAGDLKAKYVIHAVGPRMGEGDEDEKLKNATLNSLKLADEYKLESIAFPAISTGIFGYPADRCAKIMLSTIIEHLKGRTGIKKVVMCLFDNEMLAIFESHLKHFGTQDR
ncbi:MAG: macro domain-containing protein [Sedimentisphaerales bacterium]|nr:macro domain-containing protein [Sedimentisphaerales bacterium]